MPKTKAQKIETVKKSADALKSAETVVLLDFTGLSVNKMNELRRALKAMGGRIEVIKKRLLKLIFQAEGIEFDPKKFEGQTGVVFSTKDAAETSSVVYKFYKTEKNFLKILGGFHVKAKSFIQSGDIERMGQLPTREVLLAQLAAMLGAPIKKFMIVLQEKAKKG